jgi:hypothetical protein
MLAGRMVRSVVEEVGIADALTIVGRAAKMMTVRLENCMMISGEVVKW